MAGTLKIDLDAIGASATDLAKVANDFDDTDTAVNLVTDAIGRANETHRLRQAIEDFSGTWRIRRQEIKENVRYLSQTAQAVADHLSETDKSLATNLTTPPSSTTPHYSPNAPKAV